MCKTVVFTHCGPGKRGHIVADTMLPTQMLPCLPVRATFVADTNFVSGTQKMFLILFRNILCPQQMFPSLRSMETQHSFCVPRVCAPKKHHEQQCVHNNVSSFARAFTFCFVAFSLLSLLPLLSSLIALTLVVPTQKIEFNHKTRSTTASAGAQR